MLAVLLLLTILAAPIGCYPAHPLYQPLADWTFSPRQAYPPYQPLLTGEFPPRQEGRKMGDILLILNHKEPFRGAWAGGF